MPPSGKMLVMFGVILVAMAGVQLASTETPTDKPIEFAFGEVAVVDVSRLIQSHERLRNTIEGMKREVAEAHDKVRTELHRLSTLREELVVRKPGTAQYEELEEEIVRGAAGIHAKRVLLLRQLRQRQAAAYAGAYADIQEEIGRLQQEQHIGVVLNAGSGPPLEIPELDSEAGPDAAMSIQFSPERGTISWKERLAFGGWIRREMPLSTDRAPVEPEKRLAIPEEANESLARLDPDPIEVERRMDQPVIAFTPDRDITPIIEARLAARRP